MLQQADRRGRDALQLQPQSSEKTRRCTAKHKRPNATQFELGLAKLRLLIQSTDLQEIIIVAFHSVFQRFKHYFNEEIKYSGIPKKHFLLSRFCSFLIDINARYYTTNGM